MDNTPHLKNIETLLQGVIQSNKGVEGSVERLRSVEQLLERIAGATEAILKSNQRIEDLMEKAWQSYDDLGKRVKSKRYE